MRRAKTRHQVAQERIKNTAQLLVRHVHVHYAQNKLYSVQIRPLQPKNDPIMGSLCALLERPAVRRAKT